MRILQKFYAPNPPGVYLPGGAPGGGGPSKENLKDAEELKQTYQEMANVLRSVGEIFKSQLNKEARGLDTASKNILKSLGRDLKKELDTAVKTTDKLKQNTNLIAKGNRTSAELTRQIEAVESNREKIASLIEEIQRERGKLTKKEAEYVADITKQLNIQLSILNKQLSTVQKIEKAIGVYGGIMKGIAKIPILGSLIDAEKIIKTMTEAAAKGANGLQTLGHGIMATFESIGSALISGLILKGLAFIFNSVLQLDKKVFELAKNLGVSADQAQRLTNKFVDIASSSANAGLMAKDLAKTYTEMSNAVGFMVPSNRAFLETATLIQKRIGASAEDMGALAMQASLSGKTLRQTYGTIEASRQIEGARNKLSLTTKQIIEGIAKSSSAVVINFKGSVRALSDAVIRATKLGTTLDQVNKQGDSLLNFESSIQKEFEAQVLTGRDINLTRARELALMGKTGELMEELSKQQVTYDSFMGETIIGRQAEADAIGLSVEELSKKLLLQKQANQLGAAEGQSLQERYNQLIKSGKSQAEIADILGDKQAAADLAKASRAEKFEATLERLKDILGKTLEGPVGGLIDKFQAFIGDTKKMNALANTLKQAFTWVGKQLESFPSLLQNALRVAKILASVSIASAVASVVRSAGFIPGIGLVAGAVAGYKTYEWLTGILNGASGSPPSAPGGGGSSSMTEPVNPAVASAQASSASAGGKGGAANAEQDKYMIVNMVIDGEIVAKKVLKNAPKVQH